MREVLNYPGQLTRVPGAKSWIKGLANVRGALLPVIDLRQYLGSGATPLTRNTRLLVVNHRDVPAGLMVDEVLGFRRFIDGGVQRQCAAHHRALRKIHCRGIPARGRSLAGTESAPAGRKPGVPGCSRLTVPVHRAAWRS